ncbi:MAG: exostosin family protein [Patescibacteria group bacterium]
MTNETHNDYIAVYTVAPVKGIAPLFFLQTIVNKHKPVDAHLWNMFQGADGEAAFDFLRIVSDPAEADFLLFPHKYSFLRKIPKNDAHLLLSHFVMLAEKYKKKILIFAMADSDKHIDVPHSLIFRYSQYGYKQRENEIIIPPYALHFRSPGLAAYREKTWKHIILHGKSEKSTISFCGWAGFSGFYPRLMYGLQILSADIKFYLFRDKHAKLHKAGIYFRRKAMRALKHPSLVNTNFLVRKSFSAQSGLDGKNRINPEVAEKESIESIINADFVLAPKGNGNASVRFFEALSLGRLPVLVNTDCVLPLKDHIDYSKFVVSVDYTRISETERAIVDFYASLSDEEFKRRQKMARKAFELLRPGSFLKIVLSELKLKQS